MRKPFLLFCLLFTICVVGKAQSKWSYTLLVNESYSNDNYQQVIINVPNTGTSFNLDKSWQTNFSFNTNYQLNSKWRLQAGLGYNKQHIENLNNTLGTSRYRVEYLSIPLRAHYFLISKKVRVYTGMGFRTDIRLNERLPYDAPDFVADNARGASVSFEALAGIEIPLASWLSAHIEPTYATAISRYTQDIGVPVGFGFSIDIPPYTIIDKYPDRMGISLGLTFGLTGN